MTSMVERVTKAIEAAMEDGSPTGWAGEFEIADLARAAIAAMREPTEEMLVVGLDRVYVIEPSTHNVADAWESMIDAALGELGTK